MKKTRKISSVLACLLSALMLFATFAACDTTTPDGGKDPVITEISLNSTTKDLDQGDSFVLQVTATYDNGTSGRVMAKDGLTFESSAPTVASVGTTGSVQALAKGTATITAKIKDFSATCEVTVHSLTLEISDSSLTIEKDATATLTATVKRDGTVLTGEDGKVKWESDNTTVAAINDDGLITAKSVGTANIKATKGGLSETCAVEVTWTPPVGYNEIMWCEQNKLEPNTWGYWNSKDVGWANGGLATDYGVYTDETFKESTGSLKAGYEYIGMGKITFEYEITSAGPNYTYQAFYRSSDNRDGGKLHYNHDYEVTFKVLSTVAGEIHVNPHDDIRAKNEGESDDEYNTYLDGRKATGKYNPDHDFTLNANEEKTITVVFRHDDCGYIYQEGIYDNMGSALHLQLGDFPVNQKVTLAIWDFQYKDLGEADNPVACDETKHAGYVNPDATTANDVELKKEGDSVYFIVTGTCSNYTLEELKAAHGLYVQSTDWDVSKDVTAQEADLEVTLDEEGNYMIKWNITNLAPGSYMAHLAPAFLGTQYGDLFHESSLESHIECNGKTYDYVNGDFGGWTRYCLTITAA
ncbi:MAG: Ig domain-containing protein [Clostridiales bacterium]|nr:Ig domain-containing protein [Clostridiales bacterium]